jgi:hypothetical protein
MPALLFDNYMSLLQKVAAGFSLRQHRLESLCHWEYLEQPGKIFLS